MRSLTVLFAGVLSTIQSLLSSAIDLIVTWFAQQDSRHILLILGVVLGLTVLSLFRSRG